MTATTRNIDKKMGYVLCFTNYSGTGYVGCRALQGLQGQQQTASKRG